MMYREIVLSAFAKANAETPAATKTQWANYLVDVLWEDYKIQVSRRTLLNYYNHYKENDEGELTPKSRIIESLCKFMRYPNYAAFLIHHSSLNRKHSSAVHTATYVVYGDCHRDVVTIKIRREAVSQSSKEILQSA
ncbi:hypothetical protein JM84_0816 [Dokdonia sp. Hel_I_63]|uniref:hypothetical protein n=1 Tax=unclassified Dokdonia TaxID=2615033 RepID=UPI00020A60BA|nr:MULTISPECIES: hypothetical protein [unclassified Dokdonia]AEE18836.1 hypothetical protein Krodi_0852 [Dokdonia sp. 4H-3-7-5]TVZ21936.1 hypothetical protein JM84_0816 [Dokdonia sp. Hel_I_63]